MITGSSTRVSLTLLILLTGLNLLVFRLGWAEYLQYQRHAIEHGQLWRLITGHWIHLGTTHFLLNLLGLLILWQIIGNWLSTGEKLAVLLGSSLLISLGLYFFYPQISWYRGLSGSLHGLWCAGALLGMRRDKRLASVLLVLLLIKLAWEQVFGPTAGSVALTGGPVLIQAHWLGALSGLLLAVMLFIIRTFR
jgi:rhomboid family GlyGly-CTERM serine protease